MKKLFLTFIATVFIMLAVNKTTTFAQEPVKLPDFQGIDEVFFINECKAYSLGLLRNVGSAKNVLALINPSSQDLLALNSIQKVLQAELMNLVAIEQQVIANLANAGTDVSKLAPEVAAKSNAILEPLHQSSKTLETKDNKHLYLFGLYIENNGRCIGYIQSKIEQKNRLENQN